MTPLKVTDNLQRDTYKFLISCVKFKNEFDVTTSNYCMLVFLELKCGLFLVVCQSSHEVQLTFLEFRRSWPHNNIFLQLFDNGRLANRLTDRNIKLVRSHLHIYWFIPEPMLQTTTYGCSYRTELIYCYLRG